MTLTQYLNQKEPKRFPFVQLELEEFRVGVIRHTKTVHGTQRQIFVDLGEDFGTVEYFQSGDDTTLWTVDEDGNPKSRSVFNVRLSDLIIWENRNNQSEINQIPVKDVQTVIGR